MMHRERAEVIEKAIVGAPEPQKTNSFTIEVDFYPPATKGEMASLLSIQEPHEAGSPAQANEGIQGRDGSVIQATRSSNAKPPNTLWTVQAKVEDTRRSGRSKAAAVLC